MFELLQDVADRSIAFHLCEQTVSFCIFLSRDIREYGCDGAPTERISAPAGRAGPEVLRGDADQRNLIQRLLAGHRKFVVLFHRAQSHIRACRRPLSRRHPRGAFERRTDGGAVERNNLNGGFVAVPRSARPAVPRRIS